MVSTKRVMEYGQLPSEAPLETIPVDRKPPPNWPHMGEIEMDQVSFRYADNLPMVLKSVSFSVLPTQKVDAAMTSMEGQLLVHANHLLHVGWWD